MQLPNARSAIIDIAKLRDYCLNVSHSRGRHKARAFASVLGITAANAAELREIILSAIINAEAVEAEFDEFGQRYVVDITVIRQGRSAKVRTAWIVRQGEGIPRLTSSYVL